MFPFKRKNTLFGSLFDEIPLWMKLVWTAVIAIQISLLAGLIYVGVHFIQKIW